VRDFLLEDMALVARERMIDWTKERLRRWKLRGVMSWQKDFWIIQFLVVIVIVRLWRVRYGLNATQLPVPGVIVGWK
jgi:hypothetical protein